MSKVEVLKFGGSCVTDEESLKRVSDVITTEVGLGFKPVCVVSAPKGMTDLLIEAANKALAGEDLDVDGFLEELYNYRGIISSIEDVEVRDRVSREIREDFLGRLKPSLEYVKDTGDPAPLPYIVSRGELFTAIALSGYMRGNGWKTRYFPGELVIRTDEEAMDATIDLEKTEEEVERVIIPCLERGETPIVAGYAGRSRRGRITTLGRGGSDYTLTALAYALNAPAKKYTDVDGIISYSPEIAKMIREDPELGPRFHELPKPRVIDRLSYLMAQELEEKVLQDKSLGPLKKKGLPLYVKNIYHPSGEGTKISSEEDLEDSGVKIINVEAGLKVIRVELDPSYPKEKVLVKVWEALEDKDVRYATSTRAEMSFLLPSDKVEEAKEALMAIKEISVEEYPEEKATLSVIGYMKEKVGTLHRATKALSAYHVNIEQVRQTLSEYIIDFSINAKDLPRAAFSLIEEFLGVKGEGGGRG